MKRAPRSSERQADAEGAPLPRRALELETSFVQLHQLAGDRKTQSAALDAALVNAAEELENSVLLGTGR